MLKLGLAIAAGVGVVLLARSGAVRAGYLIVREAFTPPPPKHS